MRLQILLLMIASLQAAVLSSCDLDDEEDVKRNYLSENKDVSEFVGGVVRISAVRVAATPGKTEEDIAPYDEALAFHEYEVKELLEGEWDDKKIKEPPAKVRVAHWSVVNGKTISQDTTIGQEVELIIKPFDEKNIRVHEMVIDDELEIVAKEPPKFLDLKALQEVETQPDALRYDYGGFVSKQMQLYWQLRSQLELVVLGNSHASRAILTSEILDEENKNYPKALNLGTGGADGYLQCWIAEKYILPLPRLKSVIWMVSPRVFNKAIRSNHRHEIFIRSPGSDYDLQHQDELWPVPLDAPKVSAGELKAFSLIGVDAWGWTGNDKLRKLKGSKEQQFQQIENELTKVSYKFDEDFWQQYLQVLQKFTDKKINVYIVISPIHPMSQSTPAADPDGSPAKAFKDLVKRLNKLEEENPLIRFHDTNQLGGHGFTDDEFYDVDHLNKIGATKFTNWMKQWMEKERNLQTQQ